jgi:hypothetical protein
MGRRREFKPPLHLFFWIESPVPHDPVVASEDRCVDVESGFQRKPFLDRLAQALSRLPFATKGSECGFFVCNCSFLRLWLLDAASAASWALLRLAPRCKHTKSEEARDLLPGAFGVLACVVCCFVTGNSVVICYICESTLVFFFWKSSSVIAPASKSCLS